MQWLCNQTKTKVLAKSFGYSSQNVFIPDQRFLLSFYTPSIIVIIKGKQFCLDLRLDRVYYSDIESSHKEA